MPVQEESAAALYAVLAVGPGWDWRRTMIELYGDPETYTRHLRLLEADSDDDPRAAAHFVRAYHYFTTGYVEEALAQWGLVMRRLPDEPLIVQLIGEHRPSGRSPGDRVTPAPAGSGALSPAASAASSGRPGRLEGNWIALPRDDTAISLTFRPRGHVAWKVRQPGRDRGYEGYALLENRTLILSEDHVNYLLGTVQWQGDGRFTFKALADRPGEPGLTFAKVP